MGVSIKKQVQDLLLGRTNEAGIYSTFFPETCHPEMIAVMKIVNKAQQTWECLCGSVEGHMPLYIL